MGNKFGANKIINKKVIPKSNLRQWHDAGWCGLCASNVEIDAGRSAIDAHIGICIVGLLLCRTNSTILVAASDTA